MSDRPLDSLTLREKFIEAEKLTRELIDHLERGFIPKAHELRRLARRANEPEHQDEIKDVTIRSSTDALLQSDDYTRHMSQRTGELMSAIEQEVRMIFEQG
jgi:Mg2+ and Co2+ transporter CorA